MYEQRFRWRLINAAAANKTVADGISIRDRVVVVGVFGYGTPPLLRWEAVAISAVLWCRPPDDSWIYFDSLPLLFL